MSTRELEHLAKALGLENEANLKLRVAFGIACVVRVEHLLIDTTIKECLARGKTFVTDEISEDELANVAILASECARSHPGTNSMDGSGSAAVSASHAVAAALTGSALLAADYAAYASVYSYASYAVTDASAYADEYAWQLRKLQTLAV